MCIRLDGLDRQFRLDCPSERNQFNPKFQICNRKTRNSYPATRNA